jgi:uncharacterized membrane-anchored protein
MSAMLIENVWSAAKVLLALSPVIAIVVVLMFAREDDEVEDAKRKVKCQRS